jgi:lysophospholipase L1-like esterase
VAWTRYVAIGDSTTEGLDDPDGAGGYRGWADRLAERVAVAQGGLEYANLAVRGRTTAAIRAEQLGPALALEPDLMTVVAGVNDMLRPSFDPARFADELEAMLRACAADGATVATFTMPDPGRVHPAARLLRSRVAGLNDGIRAAGERSGALVLDLARHPVAGDPRLWSDDRLHANALGHERIASALAHLLEVPGSDDRWTLALSPASPPSVAATRRLADDVRWVRRHLSPWVARRVRGRSSGDAVAAKRPLPLPVLPLGG